MDIAELAVSPSSNEIHIFEWTSGQWRSMFVPPHSFHDSCSHILREHDLAVTSLDWAPSTDRIVSCSQDKNAFVWTRDRDTGWKPELVLVRINRAATVVKWSPSGTPLANLQSLSHLREQVRGGEWREVGVGVLL